MRKNARYVPDLNRLMAESESNYVRLLKLMPGFDNKDKWQWGVRSRDGVAGIVSFEVTERFKYTSTVNIHQQDHLGLWLCKPVLVIRMYHDAEMAEVVDSDNRGQLKGSYSYPNQKMFHNDEKEQLNTYLGEWLGQCIMHGYAPGPLSLEGIL